MIAVNQKQEVVGLLQGKIQKLNLSANAAAKQIGMSGASLSKILNHKWDDLSDGLWRLAMAWLGFKEDWVVAEIRNFKRLHNICKDAKTSSIAIAVSDRPGCGKTIALEQFSKKYENSFYIECEEHFTKAVFLRKLGKVMGLTLVGSVSEMVDSIINRLLKLRSPLVIIDEFDKLKDSALNLVKTFMNKTRRKAGFVLCGAPYFKKRIDSGVLRDNQGYAEIFSRFGGEFQKLKGVSKSDIEMICRSNGVESVEVINRIIGELGDKDLRKLERLIHRQKLQTASKTP